MIFAKTRERENGRIADYIGTITDGVDIVVYAEKGLIGLYVPEIELVTKDRIIDQHPPMKLKTAFRAHKEFDDEIEIDGLSIVDFT